ncbi:hypothetical protein G6011_09416 [Alternaria panax]|uniref:F-box domain-containing protein n=1 Tax=Alternaria panax TaxID=48097 RepID=A0AAD4IAX9_9PLEO|nr:hypothetical protein G6011_09416 [Alternaria panax]
MSQSQSPGRFSAPVKLPYLPCTPPIDSARSEAPPPSSNATDALPSYLRRHIQLGFTHDDVAALISSIDSSQAPPSSSNGNPTLAHLPAELLLQVLEHVPVDYVLDWRLRTQLVGYMGRRSEPVMQDLDEEEYESIHLIEADFIRVEEEEGETTCQQEKRPIWSSKHAVFKIKDEWYRAFRDVNGLETEPGDTINHVEREWDGVLGRLAFLQEEDFGQLRWCIRLDHAVLDLDFPVHKAGLHLDFDTNLHTGSIRVAWKAMLVRFLRTERALRVLMEQKRDSPFTFSHHEDCLRSIRRTRLIDSLTPLPTTTPARAQRDRAILWSMRLLRPLFGTPPERHTTILNDVEDNSICVLLLLRRTAALTSTQLSYLHNLHTTYLSLESSLRSLDETYTEFKSYLSMPGFQTNILLPYAISNARGLPRNPVAWSDELRLRIECQVKRWEAQGEVLEKVRELLEGSCEAMAAPEDGFDELGSDF